MVSAVTDDLLLGDFAAAGFAVMPATRLEVKQFQLCFGVDTVDKPLGEGVDGRGTAIVVAEDHRLDNDDSGAVFWCDLHAGFWCDLHAGFWCDLRAGWLLRCHDQPG